MKTIFITHQNTDISSAQTKITANDETAPDCIEIKIRISGDLELPLTDIVNKLESVTRDLSILTERNHIKLNVDAVRDSLNFESQRNFDEYLNLADSIASIKTDNLGRVEKLTAQICATLARNHLLREIKS